MVLIVWLLCCVLLFWKLKAAVGNAKGLRRIQRSAENTLPRQPPDEVRAHITYVWYM